MLFCLILTQIQLSLVFAICIFHLLLILLTTDLLVLGVAITLATYMHYVFDIVQLFLQKQQC
jgi:hypothetical protein